jgi:hypothetical protein
VKKKEHDKGKGKWLCLTQENLVMHFDFNIEMQLSFKGCVS